MQDVRGINGTGRYKVIFSREDVILVTGASSGIGRGVAIECARSGATVIAQGRSRERLEEARESSGEPSAWHNMEYDFRDIDGIGGWLKGICSSFGKLFGLAHCAGDGIMDSLRNCSYPSAREHFDLNFHAPLQLARAFSDKRIHRRQASIVFTASTAGAFPEKGHLTYGAAKAALTNAAKCMAIELAPAMRVNCIVPGIVDTPMQAAAERFMGASYREKMLSDYPLGFGKPADIAHMVVFLLSKKARWITGQNFILSGGRY